MLRWSFELGRIDILTEVSCLSKHLYYPIEVHIDAVYHIFRYLQKNLGKNPGRIKFNPMYELTYESMFEVVGRYLDQWKEFYPDAQEMMPIHILESLGKHVLIKYYVYANHAVNMANRRSHSGIISYLNNSTIF